MKSRYGLEIKNAKGSVDDLFNHHSPFVPSDLSWSDGKTENDCNIEKFRKTAQKKVVKRSGNLTRSLWKTVAFNKSWKLKSEVLEEIVRRSEAANIH